MDLQLVLYMGVARVKNVSSVTAEKDYSKAVLVISIAAKGVIRAVHC